MRRIHLALMLFAALVMGMAGALTWLATSAAAGPRPIDTALAPAPPARGEPPTSDSNLVVEVSPADDRLAAGEPDPMTPPIGVAMQSDAHPAVGIGVLVVDAAGAPQPDVPVALCTTERLTGRPCTLPLGKTGLDGILALPPHRLGTLVVETPGGRIGSVARTAAVPDVVLALQATCALRLDVVDARGRAIQNARVELSGPGGRMVAISDADGRARFALLALDGELNVRATSAGRSAELGLPSHRPAGRTLHEVVLLDQLPNELVTTVRDAAGAPWRERLVRFTFANGHGQRARSDAHGRIAIPLAIPSPHAETTPTELRLELLDRDGRLAGPSAVLHIAACVGITTLPPVCLSMPNAAAEQHDPCPPVRALF